jgi:hypothetical protein
MNRASKPTPWEADTEFQIERSETPVSEDGYKTGEPKFLSCEFCSARTLITKDPSDPGVDDLSHDSDCPQRFVRSEWFQQQFS